MVIHIPSLSEEIKNSYRLIVLFVGIAIAIQLGSMFSIGHFEFSLIASYSITFLPLLVAISSFLVSKFYNHSKVFGKSYFLLGISYMLFFAGEALFTFYMEPFDDSSLSMVSETLFLISTPLLLGHIIINIRYFAEKLETYQKILLVVVPSLIIAGYFALLSTTFVPDADELLFNLIFVVQSSVVLGFTIVAFTVFRHTALFVPWYLLLIGMLFSTLGDTLYRYTDTISSFEYSDPTTGLWLASSMVMIYALYKHQKSI